jgi:hypothetical protein
MSDAIELLDNIEKHYGSLNNVPECVVKYCDYLSAMIRNETKVSRLAALAELEREVEERRSMTIYGDKKFLDTVRCKEVEAILTLIRSKRLK